MVSEKTSNLRHVELDALHGFAALLVIFFHLKATNMFVQAMLVLTKNKQRIYK